MTHLYELLDWHKCFELSWAKLLEIYHEQYGPLNHKLRLASLRTKLHEIADARVCFKRGVDLVRHTLYKHQASRVLGILKENVRKRKLATRVRKIEEVEPEVSEYSVEDGERSNRSAEEPKQTVFVVMLFIARLRLAAKQTAAKALVHLGNEQESNRVPRWNIGSTPIMSAGNGKPEWKGVRAMKPNMTLKQAVGGGADQVQHFVCTCLTCGAVIQNRMDELRKEQLLWSNSGVGELPVVILGDDREWRYWKQYLLGDPVAVGYCLPRLYDAVTCILTENRIVWRTRMHT